MPRKKALSKLLDDLRVLHSDLHGLIAEYDINPISKLFEWHFFQEGNYNIWNIVQDNQCVYINCFSHGEIYRYTFGWETLPCLKHKARAMEMVNNQLYFLNYTGGFILDIKTSLIIESWNLPKEEEGSVGGYYLKVDQETIYFTPCRYSHYVYLCSKKGKEMKKFGRKSESTKRGEFNDPAGITVDEKCLYVCDQSNNRVQVLDKENGTFISQWNDGTRDRIYLSILLYENLLYLGHRSGIQVFTKKGECLQIFGSWGSGEEEFKWVSGLCIVNDKLFIADQDNHRIQVWS